MAELLYETKSYIFDTVASCYQGGDLTAWHLAHQDDHISSRFWHPKSSLFDIVKNSIDLAVYTDRRNLVSNKRVMFILSTSTTGLLESCTYDYAGKLLEHRIY
jgi:hypothetical protein